MKLITLDEVYSIWYKIRNPEKYISSEERFHAKELSKNPDYLIAIHGFKTVKIYYNFYWFCEFVRFHGYVIY
jgi:hypothetical protein